MTLDRPWRWSWALILGTGVALAYGAIFYSLSVLITGDAAGSEFSATALSIAYSVFVLISGGLAAVVGRLADRHGIRPLVWVGMMSGAAGMLLLGRASAPWQTIVIAAVFLGPAGALTLYEVAFVAIDRWFGAQHRARALATVTLLGGVAGPVFLPLTGALVETLGWRQTTAVLAGVLASGALLATALPGRRSWTLTVHEGPSPDWRALLGDRRFVLFTASIVLQFGGIQAVFFHRIAVFDEAGVSLTVVTAWAAASSLISFPGRWMGPYLANRVGAIRLYVAGIVCLAVAAAIAARPSVWAMGVHFVVFGIAFGAMLPIRAVVMSGWYSGPSYGRILGTQWTIAAISGAAFPALAGWLRDLTGSYAWPFAAVAVSFLLAAAAASLAGRPAGDAPG